MTIALLQVSSDLYMKVAELRLLVRANPTVNQGFRQFARVNLVFSVAFITGSIAITLSEVAVRLNPAKPRYLLHRPPGRS
jgi:hypothetical protein